MIRCFHETLTDSTFSREAEVTFPGCDPRRQAKLSTLLGFAVAVAGADYDARELPYETLRALGQVFLLSRMTLHVHQVPRLGDILTVTTWEDGIRGVHMCRGCTMTDQEGNLRVSARSHWILVDPENRKILRPSAFTARKIQSAGLPLDCPDCRKVLMPREGLEHLGQRRVVWSDLDGNGHVYSGNYGGIFWDYLPADLQTAAFRQFTVNYHKEAVLGETLELTGCRAGDRYLMAGCGNGEVCFTAECIFEPQGQS